MTSPRARLVVSALLFFGWLSFLAYLVFTSNKVILSRPQFLIAQLYVVAEVRGGEEVVKVDEVPWSADPGDAALVHREIRVVGLGTRERVVGFQEPGLYLLPLQKLMKGGYRIAPLPPSAGTAELRIYPWTPGTEQQLKAIIDSRK